MAPPQEAGCDCITVVLIVLGVLILAAVVGGLLWFQPWKSDTSGGTGTGGSAGTNLSGHTPGPGGGAGNSGDGESSSWSWAKIAIPVTVMGFGVFGWFYYDLSWTWVSQQFSSAPASEAEKDYLAKKGTCSRLTVDPEAYDDQAQCEIKMGEAKTIYDELTDKEATDMSATDRKNKERDLLRKVSSTVSWADEKSDSLEKRIKVRTDTDKFFDKPELKEVANRTKNTRAKLDAMCAAKPEKGSDHAKNLRFLNDYRQDLEAVKRKAEGRNLLQKFIWDPICDFFSWIWNTITSCVQIWSWSDDDVVRSIQKKVEGISALSPSEKIRELRKFAVDKRNANTVHLWGDWRIPLPFQGEEGGLSDFSTGLRYNALYNQLSEASKIDNGPNVMTDLRDDNDGEGECIDTRNLMLPPASDTLKSITNGVKETLRHDQWRVYPGRFDKHSLWNRLGLGGDTQEDEPEDRYERTDCLADVNADDFIGAATKFADSLKDPNSKGRGYLPLPRDQYEMAPIYNRLDQLNTCEAAWNKALKS